MMRRIVLFAMVGVCVGLAACGPERTGRVAANSVDVRWLEAERFVARCTKEGLGADERPISESGMVRSAVLERAKELNPNIRNAAAGVPGPETMIDLGSPIAQLALLLPKKILEEFAEQLRREAQRYTATFQGEAEADAFWEVAPDSARDAGRLYDAIEILRLVDADADPQTPKEKALHAVFVLAPERDGRVFRLVPVYFADHRPKALLSGWDDESMTVAIDLKIRADVLEDLDRGPTGLPGHQNAGRYGHGLVRETVALVYRVAFDDYSPGEELFLSKDLRGTSPRFTVPRPRNPFVGDSGAPAPPVRVTAVVTEMDEGHMPRLLTGLADLIDDRSDEIVQVVNRQLQDPPAARR